MRFENRVLEDWLEERVSSYFLCDMSALDVVPVCSGKNFIDVVIKWEGGKRWLIRCFSTFERLSFPPAIGGMVDMCRVAMVLKAKPMIAYVSDDRIEVVWSSSLAHPSQLEQAA